MAGWRPQYIVNDSNQTVPAHLSSFLLLYNKLSKSFLVIKSLTLTSESPWASNSMQLDLDKVDDTSPIRKFELMESEL